MGGLIFRQKLLLPFPDLFSNTVERVGFLSLLFFVIVSSAAFFIINLIYIFVCEIQISLIYSNKFWSDQPENSSIKKIKTSKLSPLRFNYHLEAVTLTILSSSWHLSMLFLAFLHCNPVSVSYDKHHKIINLFLLAAASLDSWFSYSYCDIKENTFSFLHI